MFRFKLKERKGVLTAASAFASARALYWVPDDGCESAGERRELTDRATASTPAASAVPAPSPAEAQQILTAGGSSAKAALEATERDTLDHSLRLATSELTSPTESLQCAASSAKAAQAVACQSQAPPTPAVSDGPSKAAPACSSGAGGSQQAASTQLHEAAVCPVPSRRILAIEPGSESPTSPCTTGAAAGHHERHEQQQQLHSAAQQPARLSLHPVAPQDASAAMQGHQPALQHAPIVRSDQHLHPWQLPVTRDVIAHAKIEALRAKYLAKTIELKKNGAFKEDMQAASALKHEGFQYVYGHIPGVLPGDIFSGKGECAVIGIHGDYGKGICCKGGKPAYSIVLTGAYIDDTDCGTKIEYSGQGGIVGGVQVKDQEWKAGNAALRLNVERRLPVRVLRRRDKRSNALVYNGLYMVNKACMITGKSGYNVCSFELEAIEGHAQVTAAVAYTGRALGRKRLQDGASSSHADPLSSSKKPKLEHRSGVIMEDLACGKERVRIPVINEIDNTRLPPIDYQRHNSWRNAQAEQVHREARQALRMHNTCGLNICQPLGMSDFYTANGELQCTVPEGVYECPQSCTAPACQKNRVVSKGMKLPLEVFYTGPGRGWGVRCRAPIPTGTFICEYAGEVLTDQQAEELKQVGEDVYLFNLDHFHLMHQELETKGASAERTTLPRLPYDPTLPKNWFNHPQRKAARQANHGQESAELEDSNPYLVVDARLKGNVGRFVNHSCSPNCVIVSVMTEASGDDAAHHIHSSSGLCYRICLFAEQDIPACKELVYNYSYSPLGREMACLCGSAACCSVLL